MALRIERNDLQPSETFLIKIPVTIPYPIHQNDFERVNGEFEYKGEFYQLVKHKLANDTLYIVCAVNNEQKELANTIKEYVKLSNDLPGATKQALSFLGKLLKDFDRGTFAPDLNPAFAYVQVAYPDFSFSSGEVSIAVTSPPPEA